MTRTEHLTILAWNHIRQCGATFARRGDTLILGYRALKKQGKVTIEGSLVKLAGDYRRAFIAGEEVV